MTEQPLNEHEEAVSGEASLSRSQRVTLVVAGILGLLVIALIFWMEAWLDARSNGGPATNGIQVERIIEGPGVGDHPRFNRPMGVAYGPDGRVYVADAGNARVAVFSPSGRFEREFGGRGVAKPAEGFDVTWQPGRLNYPVSVDVDSDGTVYVADFHNDSISAFDADGTYLRRFPDPYKVAGRGGSGQGGVGIAVTSVAAIGGKVYATDRYQVFVFSKDGELLQQFGRPGAGEGQLDHPNGIAVDSTGRIFVSDSNNNRVTAFYPNGEVIWVRGARLSDLRSETAEPLVLPRGLTIERGGTLLVADTLGQQVVRLDTDGSVIRAYGQQGSAPGQLSFPADVSARGDSVAIADRANNRVQLVRLSGR